MGVSLVLLKMIHVWERFILEIIQKNNLFNFFVKLNLPIKGIHRKIYYMHNLCLHYSFPINICNSSPILGVLAVNKLRNSEYIENKVYLL